MTVRDDGGRSRRQSWPQIAPHSIRPLKVRQSVVVAVAVVLLSLLDVWVVAMQRGAAGPWHHLAYLPILVAAYGWGLRGALLAAIPPAIVSGPLGVASTAAGGAPAVDATIRVAMFLTVAVATGRLFDHLRAARDSWRSAAETVTEREREGMLALARGAEAKDIDTGDHVLRVEHLSERLALALGLDRELASTIAWAGMLHDVGKLHVPDRILLKPGPLTPEEWRTMRMHPLWGAEILDAGPAFATARRIARWHHENIDGSGYPDGLRGHAIPLEARVVRVADAFDAMTHRRPYQPARSVEWALEELRRNAGRQFDPDIVEALLRLADEPGALRGALASGQGRRPWQRRLTAVPIIEGAGEQLRLDHAWDQDEPAGLPWR